jgi:hypothetical protein
MIFVLTRKLTMEQSTSLGASGAFLADRVEKWSWAYHQGSDKNIGEVLAVGPEDFRSEREARSQIAKVRKAFGGARLARVIVPSDGTDTIG